MKKYFKSVVIIGLLLGVAACGGSGIEKKKAKLEKLKAQQGEIASQIKDLEAEISASGDTSSASKEKFKYVLTAPVEISTFYHYIDVQGRVDGDENTTISSRAMGPVIKVNVKSGDRVSKGQVLAELDGEIIRKQIADLKTSLQFATDVFNKQKALWDKQIGTEVQYLSAKNNKESLEQKLATMNENLDMYRIKAPINGTIDEVFIKIGQNIAPGMPCFRVVNFSSLKVKADVAETYSSQIREGNEVMLIFPDLNHKEIRSSINFTSRVINPMNRTFTIEAGIPSDPGFFPNMVCVFKVVDYKSPKAIVIPVNTIQKNEVESYVMIVENKGGKDVASKRVVSVGKIYGDKAEITSGLNAGDKLIIKGYQDVNNNELVKE